MKAIAAVSIVACTVLAVTIVVMYLNFTALIQQQSDFIKEQADKIDNLRGGLDNMIGIIYDYGINALPPDIWTNQTAQEYYFQSPD